MLRKQLRQTFCCRHCVAVASAVAFTAAAAAVADVAVSATILCWSACQRCPLSLSLAAVRAALLHALCVCVCVFAYGESKCACSCCFCFCFCSCCCFCCTVARVVRLLWTVKCFAAKMYKGKLISIVAGGSFVVTTHA